MVPAVASRSPFGFHSFPGTCLPKVYSTQATWWYCTWPPGGLLAPFWNASPAAPAQRLSGWCRSPEAPLVGPKIPGS